MKRVIERVGVYQPKFRRNHYEALARAIVWQQISGHAAKTIWGRLTALSHPSPLSAEILIRHNDAALRGAGISPQKMRYLRDLSERILDGRLTLKKLTRLPDADVIEQLIEVKGIGQWTAQMFLMFSLGRPDVFAPDDLGLRSAIRKLHGLGELPKRVECDAIALRWQPYRTIAAWYLWRSLELK
jgi:DNA-3-methyladenine glycosylase II